jgi:hypothetical protein
MSGFLGAVEGIVGGVAGGFTGGDFMSELLNAFGETAAQNSGNSTTNEMGQVVSDVLPIVASFL